VGHGERHRRRSERRKLIRQQLVVVAVFLVALIIALLVLGQQWLNSGSRSGSSPSSRPGVATTLTGEHI
jgi:ABC-type cobalamin transport system permease subunit